MEGQLNLPGWSFARTSPRKPKKHGWECPVPTVEDWEDYKEWKAGQSVKDELPAAPQVFLGDTTLLFHQDSEVQLPWIHRLKAELPRRVGRLSGELPVKASYVGFGTDDNPEHYELFKQAVAQIGVVLIRQIHNPPSSFELAHLEQSDLILVGGGERRKLWKTLSTDLGMNAIGEHIKWRYLMGAVIVAVGEAMSLLGEKSWYMMDDKTPVPFTGWGIFPHIVAPVPDVTDLEDMVEPLGGPRAVILGVHKGGGMIFNKDGLVEPVRTMVEEYRWDWRTESVKHALLLGPPRSTGLICPLYAAMKSREGEEDDKPADVFTYCLTEEEEHEEEHLMENFNPFNLWLPVEKKQEIEDLKVNGNAAFKTGKADLANLKYEQALVVLHSCARRWSELDDETKQVLTSMEAPETAKLPSERQRQQMHHLGKKEDFQATPLMVSLQLNLCASYLLAHEQDQKKAQEQEATNIGSCGNAAAATVTGDTAGEAGHDHEQSATLKKAKQQPASDAGTVHATAPEVAHGNQDGTLGHSNVQSSITTLVEVRNNLASAFYNANAALVLSGGQSAKAWYRRGVVFERMRDFRNAERDFEQALVRAPGDKSITSKRNEVKDPASKVAENMFYNRHKELDPQQERLKVETRRALLLRGSYCDKYEDSNATFSIAQPLAVLVEGALEDIDGKPQLVLPASAGEQPDAPYLHPHALWTWEFLIQQAIGLQLLQIEDVDLGSGPLEWLCKGLRTHSKVQILRLVGVHLGPEGAKMLRNVIAQNKSLLEIALDSCAMLDSGLDEIASGFQDCSGPLETLSLKQNHFTSKRLSKLVDAFSPDRDDLTHGIQELDLSGNPLGTSSSTEIARMIGSDKHHLRVLRLQDCRLDFVAFWRLVGQLNDLRPLSVLDLRVNPIGRGTRRVWHSQMGPTIRCDVLMSDHPWKAWKEVRRRSEEAHARSYPLPSSWF